MSLQVWLPLNGSMENQGLLNLIPTQQGTISWIDGKIGKCLSAGSASQTDNGISYNSNLINELGNEFSAAIWVKPLGNHVHYNGTFVSSGNWNGKKWAFGVSQDNSQVDVFCQGYNTYLTCAVPVNTWTHLVCVHQGTTVKLYKNGEYIGEKTGVPEVLDSDATNFCVGRETYASGYFSFNGNLNDLRIYDHALSVKEIKELSKGLVLHYKLDGKNETTANLITTEDCLSSTAYNAANGKYGYGADSNIQKTVGDFNGKHCTKVSMITAGVSARPYVYFSNLFTSNGTNQPEYKTLSFDYYGTIGTYLNPYKLGSGNGTCTWKNVTTGATGSFTNTGNVSVVPNKWNHIELIFHGTTDANAEWGYIILGDTHTSAATNYWLFANGQLETKDHATPYVGVGGNRTYTVEPDCSGYGHNGVVTGTLTHSITSPRYNGCVHISATNQKIRASELTTSGFNNSYSFSWWAKCSSWSNLMHWGFSDGIRLNGIYNGILWNTGDGSNNPLYNIGTTTQVTVSDTNWHHWVMTGNGTKCYVYKDGVLWAEAKTYKAISGTSIYINGWDSSTSYSNTNLDIVDFRIYATALSAEDVLELYHTSASIDNKGNIYAYELEEV